MRSVGRRLGAGLLVIALLGVIVGSASAETRRSQLLSELVAWVAGRTVSVSCETGRAAWEEEVEAAALTSGVVAYYDPNADLVRFGPTVCNPISSPRKGVTLARVAALFVVAHEAAHVSGIDDEGVANCWGLYWAQGLARLVYGVEFFTPRSRQVLAWARQIQRDSPPEYRAACPV